jgi:hypothetical protein
MKNGLSLAALLFYFASCHQKQHAKIECPNEYDTCYEEIITRKVTSDDSLKYGDNYKDTIFKSVYVKNGDTSYSMAETPPPPAP